VDAIPTPLTVHLSHFPQISLPLGRLHLAPLTDYGKCTSNRSSEIGEIRRALHAKRFANVKQFLYIFGNHPAPLRKYRSKGMGSFEGLILSFRVCYYWIFLVLVFFPSLSLFWTKNSYCGLNDTAESEWNGQKGKTRGVTMHRRKVSLFLILRI